MQTESLNIKNIDNIKTLLREYKKAINEESIVDDQIAKLKNAMLNKDIIFYGIFDGGELIGMCSISVIFSTYKFEPVGVFDDFYIKNEHRKKGCAGKLVNYAFNDMRSKGVNSVLVGCSKADTGMYRHLGFNTELGNLLGWDGEAIPGK